MTFPLPLVPFEQYMLADNSAAYPRVFVIEVHFLGIPDRSALETAWNLALTRHPMLRALLVKTRAGWQWTEVSDISTPVRWETEGEPFEFADGELIDLTREPGVRLWVRTTDNTTRLVLQFHHACCDGVGGLQFIGDFLALYDAQCSPDREPPTLVSLQPDLLAGRGTFGLTKPTIREMLRDIRVGIREGIRLMSRRPLTVEIPPRDDKASGLPCAFPGIESHTFSATEHRELRRRGKEVEATLNDLLMCYLMQAIVDWNALHSQKSSEGWLRINIPTNLRRKEDEAMPAANVMSFTFVDRRTQDCRDVRSLLESIRREMQDIKRWRMGLYFIGQLALLGSIPKGMFLLLAGKRCFATAVLTNVGDPARRFSVRFNRRDGRLAIGNLLLNNIFGAPPLRPLTRLGVAISTYAGQLTVSVLCDRHDFNRQQTRQMLETYVARIKQGIHENAPAIAEQ